MTTLHHTVDLTRSLGAPRDEVWEAWTDPEILARWWWPARFQTVYEVDLRVGGTYTFRTAELPDIGVLGLTGSYLAVTPPEQLAYTWRWEGQDESPTEVTVKFGERGEQTEVRLTHRGFPSEEERENHVVGWSDCLDRLQRLLTPT